MKKTILISRQTCQNITIALLFFAALTPLPFETWRSELLTYIANVSVILFVAGFLVAAIMDRIVISRLRVRFPEWKNEIEKYGFMRIFREKSPDAEKILNACIRKDADFEQISEELFIIKIYSAIWVYFPMILVVCFILRYAFFTV